MGRNRFLIGRMLQLIPQVVLLTVVSFGVVHLAPGTPGVNLSSPSTAQISEEQIRAIAAYWGLDRPLHIQYLRWLRGVLTLDFGRSYVDGRPVLDRIEERVVPTLALTMAAQLIALLAIPIGILVARWRYSWLDYSSTIIAFWGVSIPAFWLSLMLIMVFSVWLHWLPSGGIRSAGQEIQLLPLLRHLILPAMALGVGLLAPLVRYMRSSILECLLEDYVRTARAKGLNERAVLTTHVLRNSLLPIVTILGLSLPWLIGGAVLVESVFALPGMGRLAVEAAYNRDFPVTMALVVITGILVSLGNLVADVCYAVADPRIRLE